MTTAVQGFLRPAAVGTSGPCKVSMNGGTEKQLGRRSLCSMADRQSQPTIHPADGCH